MYAPMGTKPVQILQHFQGKTAPGWALCHTKGNTRHCKAACCTLYMKTAFFKKAVNNYTAATILSSPFYQPRHTPLLRPAKVF
jgi:hypothetical protein